MELAAEDPEPVGTQTVQDMDDNATFELLGRASHLMRKLDKAEVGRPSIARPQRAWTIYRQLSRNAPLNK
jgi:hypothetical protein